MTSIRLKFRPSSVPGKQGVLNYQVIHRRTTRLIRSSYQIYADEWDGDSSKLVIPANNPRKEYLRLIRDKTAWELRQLQKVISSMEQKGMEYTADDIVTAFSHVAPAESVFCFINGQISKLKQQRRVRTAQAYNSTLNSFSAFRKNADLCFESLDSDLMQLYESYLRGKGLIRNSSSFYLRILRTVYNLAVERGLTDDKKPFRHVYTGIDKTMKRAIPFEYIRKMKRLDLTSRPDLDFARDIFLFSFYTRGMSFIDIAFLKKSDLRNGSVSYCRRKTGQRLTFLWEKQMDGIVKKYSDNHTRYMLPIIRNEGVDERKQYHLALKQTNARLKKIAAQVGIRIPLTLYVARHSWASIAKEKHIPTSVISEGMGHDSETTTRIYLMALDTSVVDRANKKILRNL